MKRLICFFVFVAVMLSLCGCGEKAEESRFADGSHVINAENFPKIYTTENGYDLAVKIAGTVLGKEFNEETKDLLITKCSGSNEAYTALAERRCDMVIALTPTETAAETLSSAGVTLDSIGLKKDALVLFCNADNPLTDLTGEQVASLLSGSITKWNQLGGENTAFTAVLPKAGSYERELLSAKYEIAETVPKPRRNITTADGALTCSPDVYDNGKDVLGFGMYSSYNLPYASAKGSVRAFTVDGIAPTVDGYPFNCELLLSVRGELSPENPVKLVFDWMRSGQGNAVIEAFKGGR